MPITKRPTRPSPMEASLTPSASQRLTHEGSGRVCGRDPDTVTPQDSGVVWVHLVPLDWKRLEAQGDSGDWFEVTAAPHPGLCCCVWAPHASTRKPRHVSLKHISMQAAWPPAQQLIRAICMHRAVLRSHKGAEPPSPQILPIFLPTISRFNKHKSLL